MWEAGFAGWGNGFCSFGPSFGHGSWFFGWLFPLLFWGIAAYIVFSILRYLFSLNQTNQNDQALDILRNRYASGEINEQEYMAQKSVLGRN